MKRLDLIACGRTVVGGPQDIRAPEIQAVPVDFDTQMRKLGMSSAAMHNEVVPGQHEIALIFALGDVSADQSALCQDVCPTVLWLTG